MIKVKVEKTNNELSEEKLDHEDDAHHSAMFINGLQTKLDEKDADIKRLEAVVTQSEIEKTNLLDQLQEVLQREQLQQEQL